jgi:hypothetical protein
MDADVVVKRFNNRTSQQAKASQLGQHGDGDSWRELRKILDVAVPDKAKVEAQQLESSLHSVARLGAGIVDRETRRECMLYCL